ncbi:MAG: beta-propeller fold lactonase family protein [Litorimonas sp.]
MGRFLLSFFTCTGMLASTSAIACTPPFPHPEFLLVGNKGENTVSFIEMETGREVSRRPVSANAPHEIAVSQHGRFAAVVNYGDAVIDVFDISFQGITASINLGKNTRPHGLLALKSGGFIATTEGNNSIVLLTPDHDLNGFPNGPCPIYNWAVDSIPTGQDGTHMVAISPDERIAYTANMQSGTVSRIDLETEEVISAPAGKEVEGVAVTKDGSEVWASVRGEDKVVIFDATTLEQLSEIKVGKFPLRIIVSPDGKNMVTSNLMDGTVTVLDVASRTVERTIRVSGSDQTRQVTLLFSDDGSRLYVAETGANKIAEIDFESGDILGRLSGGEQGDGLAIAPAFRWDR